MARAQRTQRLKKKRLKVPETRPYPAEFYKEVAAQYSLLETRRSDPAAIMAEANNKSVLTIDRWVREARRRGFLPQGQRGGAR
jgi:hypothetical protein